MRRNRSFAPSLDSLPALKLPSDLMPIAIAVGNPLLPPPSTPIVQPVYTAPASNIIPLEYPSPSTFLATATS
jgi:hypothetical protein